MVSVKTIQFCYYSTKVGIHIIYKQMNVAVFHKAVFTKTDSRPDFLKPCTNTFSLSPYSMVVVPSSMSSNLQHLLLSPLS